MLSGNPAVPCNIPRKRNFEGRISNIIKTTGAQYYLTTESQLKLSKYAIEQNAVPYKLTAILDVEHITPDFIKDSVKYHPSDTAFIQFTSGSTKKPRGALITHNNLRTCLNGMKERWDVSSRSVFGTWLPQFHDLGLIFGLLLPLYVGAPVITMRPAAFMQRPERWFEMINGYRCTHTAAPSFAYQHCVDKITRTDADMHNLNTIKMAMNAAEPINPSTIESFNHKFDNIGFVNSMFTPAYGLAESTLAVTASSISEPPVFLNVCDHNLQLGRVVIVDNQSTIGRTLVSSGKPLSEVDIRIKDSTTFKDLDDDTIGEIWISGDYIAQGYYNDPDSSSKTFPCLQDASSGALIRWLRTGDLGFLHQSNLFITGRSDDVLVVNGKNYYPQDIEWIAQSQSSSIRNNCGAAIGILDGSKIQIILVQEVERDAPIDQLEVLADQTFDSILDELDLALSQVVFTELGSISRTSSGKIQRSSTKNMYASNQLKIVYQRSFLNNHGFDAYEITSTQSTRMWIANWLAGYNGLNVDSDQINKILRLGRIDLDSRDSAELVINLEAKTGKNLPDTLIWDYPTIDLLADFLDNMEK
jgi:acyl-CoA synthetase (AMP-forming)/AMP-acid ligase II/acyl carrier protein